MSLHPLSQPHPANAASKPPATAAETIFAACARRAETLRTSQLFARLAWLFILAPVFLGFYYVHTYGVNVVWEDQWGILSVFEKHDAGTLTLLDFWKQHNEHRHCIPEMVMYVLAFATRWNVVAEMWVTQAMLLGMLAMLLSVFRRECASRYRTWFMVPIALVAMGLRQSQNLLFGWQIGFVMIAVSAVAALYCLYLMNRPGRRRWKFAGAVAAATVATCSGGSGPLVWIAGLVPLELLPLNRRRKTILFVGWIILGIFEWIIYFYGYKKPPTHPDAQLSLQYGLAFAGGALYPSLLLGIPGEGVLPLPLMAICVGAIILFLALVSTVLSFTEHKSSPFSFWLGLIAYSLLVDGATTLGRAGFGPGQALSTRYATFSGLAVIGVFGILTCLAAVNRTRPIAALWGCLFSLIVSGLVLSSIEGFEIAAHEKLAKEYQAFVLSTGETQPDEVVRGATSEAEDVRRGIVLLRRHGWNVFAPGGTAAHYAAPPATLPVVPAEAKSGLSQFGIQKDTNYLMVRGFATNAEGNDVAGGVFLDIDGTLYPTFYGMPSPGLAQWLAKAAAGGAAAAVSAPANDRLEHCGFQRAFIPGLLPKGHHRLAIKVLTKDGTASFAPQALGEFNVE